MNTNNLKSFEKEKIQVGLQNTIFLQSCMTEQFFPMMKMQHTEKKNNCQIDLFHQNKHDHQLFLQFFRQAFKKQHKIRIFDCILSSGCTKGCTFESYDYSKHILLGNDPSSGTMRAFFNTPSPPPTQKKKIKIRGSVRRCRSSSTVLKNFLIKNGKKKHAMKK